MKKDLCQFYTKPSVAVSCLQILYQILEELFVGNKIQFIEPSAGSGSFLLQLPNKIIYFNKKRYSSRLGFDLEPKHIEIAKLDFLKEDINDNYLVPYQYRVIVGNPPFGKRATLAIDFFNRSAKLAPIIAFIVPIQFEKWSVHSKLDENFDLIYSKILDKNSFLRYDKEYDVNCCFQIWTCKSNSFTNLRLLRKPKTEHKDFTMWQYNNTKEAEKVFKENFDFAVLRQGYGDYTKHIYDEKECDRKKQWILFKANDKTILRRLESLDYEELSKKNTTVPGFGKADVVKLYEDTYGH